VVKGQRSFVIERQPTYAFTFVFVLPITTTAIGSNNNNDDNNNNNKLIIIQFREGIIDNKFPAFSSAVL